MLRSSHILGSMIVLVVAGLFGCIEQIDLTEPSIVTNADQRTSRQAPSVSQDTEALATDQPLAPETTVIREISVGDWHGIIETEPQGSCGNGVIDSLEQCDDSNTNPSDGCHTCRLTGAHEIFFQVHGVPQRADRVFITIDGPGLNEPIVDVETTLANDGVMYALTPLGAGGPYRVRLLAATGSGTPIALAGGIAEDIEMPYGEAVSVVVELSPFEVSVLEETPEAVESGDLFFLKMSIDDPAHALEGYRWGRIWYDYAPFEDLAGQRQTGFLMQATDSRWDLTAEVTAQGPNVDRSFFYQFGQPLDDFAFKDETPFLVYPSVTVDENLFSLDVREAVTDVTVVVSSIPLGADRVVLTVDRGVDTAVLFEIEGEREGRLQPFELQIPVGTGYRVHATALADGVPSTNVIAGAVRDYVTVPHSGDLEFNLRLSEFDIEADSEWPEAVEAGSVVELQFTVSDPGDLLVDFETVTAIWSMADGDGDELPLTGELWEVTPGEYAGRILWSVPNVTGTVDIWLGVDDWWGLDDRLLFRSDNGTHAPLFSINVI